MTKRAAVQISGKQLASERAAELSQRLKNAQTAPHLAIVLVGDNPASEQYVRMKQKQAEAIGIATTLVRIQTECQQSVIHATVTELANDPNIHGILIQLPLPQHVNTQEILDLVPAAKDIDGISSASLDALEHHTSQFLPAVAKGVLSLIQSVDTHLQGKKAVIIGNSKYTGHPIGMLLKHHGAEVTFCDEFTPDIPSIAREADILISAVGKPQFVTKEYVKEGAIVIDVGTSVQPETGKIVGDCDYESVSEVARAVTPVPGGVGPMTIISLLEQTVTAWENSQKSLN